MYRAGLAETLLRFYDRKGRFRVRHCASCFSAPKMVECLWRIAAARGSVRSSSNGHLTAIFDTACLWDFARKIMQRV
jgi:hypothetical protein